MIHIKGKYNQSLIFIDQVEEGVIQQLYKMMNHPAFKESLLR